MVYTAFNCHFEKPKNEWFNEQMQKNSPVFVCVCVCVCVYVCDPIEEFHI